MIDSIRHSLRLLSSAALLFAACSNGYKLSGVEAVSYNRCRLSTWVAGVVDGSIFSLITWSILSRVQVPRSRPIRAALTAIPTALAAVIYARPNTCRLQLVQRTDSPLAADVRTVLRSRYPNNDVTGALDAKVKEQPEKDRQGGTGMPLLWDLKVTDLEGPGGGSVRRGEEELGALKEQSTTDVMVVTEDEPNASYATRVNDTQSRLPSAASSIAIPSLSSAQSSTSASRPSAPPQLPRSRPPLSTTARDSDNPFTDDSPRSRHTPAEAAEEERRRRRDEREKVRKQHEDERRQRMEQRSRDEGRLQSGGGGGVEGKRRFVKRNEFGDEVFDDDLR